MAMVSNLMKPLLSRRCSLLRLEVGGGCLAVNSQLMLWQVHFHVSGRGLDSTIRRAAHIMFLESTQFSRALVSVLKAKLSVLQIDTA